MVYAPFWGSHYATIAIKYLLQTARTLLLLAKHRPQVVFVMAPPVVACLPVWLYTKLTKGKYVIDAHTGAFLDRRWQRVLFLQRFFSRRAVTTIVTNGHLQQMVERWGAAATIVTDVPVCFVEPEAANLEGDVSMTVVSSFGDDEPTELLLDALARVPKVRFYVTGDPKLLKARTLAGKPANVTFTGFLSDAAYAGQLQASDAVIVLTTRDHTMQRGAYEAIYLGVPVVTSNFGVLREAFHKGAVHVDATVDDIVRGIEEMRDNLDRYRGEAKQLRIEKLQRWDETARHLAKMLELSVPAPLGEEFLADKTK